MALGSWMGIYIQVSDDLMAQRREQELLLLMAIARHADRLGFCFPGRARLKTLRHAGDKKHDERLAWLMEYGYVTMIESYDYRRRQAMCDYQVSPRALYVREDFQAYCEAVFDGVQERDFALEKKLLENLFSTKDSQPEVVTRIRNQTQEPDAGSRRKTSAYDQRSPRTVTEQKQGRNPSTMRNGRQAAPTTQPTADSREAHRENNPQAGGPAGDEFHALLSPTVDNDRIVQEIMHVATTTEHQARDAVQSYPRDAIVHWLRITAVRRAKGELSKPGGWFFTSLRSTTPRIDPTMPNGSTYQDWENDRSEDVEL